MEKVNYGLCWHICWNRWAGAGCREAPLPVPRGRLAAVRSPGSRQTPAALGALSLQHNRAAAALPAVRLACPAAAAAGLTGARRHPRRGARLPPGLRSRSRARRKMAGAGAA